MRVRSFAKAGDQYPLPNLVDIQTVSYEQFLQSSVPPKKRADKGVEGVLRESFPIESHDGAMKLEYLYYELGKPRYSADECRKLRLTYGMPFRIWVRLHKSGGEVIEEEVYLGEIPVMMGGGEFVINGAERVIVSQLHRSPGVDFLVEIHTGGRKLHSCRIIPERGSWIEMDVTKKDILAVRIDQSGKFSITMFLRAMDPKYSTDADILRVFYPTEKIQIGRAAPGRASGAGDEAPSGKELTRKIYEMLSVLDKQHYSSIDQVPPHLADKKGLYLFFEKGQDVSLGKKTTAMRLVEIGKAEDSTFKKRLGEHLKGEPTASGSFAVEVGIALVLSGKYQGSESLAEKAAREEFARLWKQASTDGKKPKELKDGGKFASDAKALQEAVADYLSKAFEFVCIPLDEKSISRLEKALIGQMAQCPLDMELKDWLGNHCLGEDLQGRKKGLWNIQSLDASPLVGREFGLLCETTGYSASPEDVVPISSGLTKLKGCVPVEDVVHPVTGEVLAGPRDDKDPALDAEKIRVLTEAGVKEVEVIKDLKDRLVLDTLRQDNSVSHEDALKRIFQRLRPGNPANMEKAQQLFHDKFFDSDRYRLGMVGRFRLNRKFGQNVPETEMTLKPEDIVHAMQYILKLRVNEGTVDDIDHLGNRRLRTIDELAGDELRKGFLKLRHTVRERMSLKEPEDMTPRSLINSKTISSAIDFFFGRSELSQVVDQTNPLSQLSHERRLSALGPGGLNRKRASFEVRDVHISHYGRICPIETPEGTNIGLISNLSLFATVDKYGFLITPYRVLKNGRVTGEIKFLRADEEEDRWVGPADIPVEGQKVVGTQVLARRNGEFVLTAPATLEYMDVSPKQMLGVSAALIPFLEHNDANRALMGSNMQRQAVPLMTTEPPVVATGVERAVAIHSGMVIRAKEGGKITAADADHIVIDDKDRYDLRKFVGLNERTCLTQKPLVKPGDTVKAGDVIADGAGTFEGELALGRNVLVAFMIWDGYNFEDAIIISERLVKKDTYTSIHIEEFEVEIRETKLGREEFTRDIPNVSERQLRNLDKDGIIRIGTHVNPGDILVGKVSPKSKSELSPEEKLLHAIFGRAGEDVKNESLEVPPGVEGVVIEAHQFSRKAYMPEDKRKAMDKEIARIEKDSNAEVAELFKKLVDELEKVNGDQKLKTQAGETISIKRDMTDAEVCRMEEIFDIEAIEFSTPARQRKAAQLYEEFEEPIDKVRDERELQINHLKRGDELPSGVLEMVKIYVATKRKLSVGDKMAGRHGNKGVIAKILPEEDMPYLADGTPVDIILNPLGVPSRMNVGQILETHLGWAAQALGFQAVTPPFDGCSEEEIRELLKSANLPQDGKVVLYDGRTGERFEQEVTVGSIYMMKLHHLVDDKVHARATGPYSLITQQPLGGKARMGGQRFGEMEVWALEAYGAAYILQELLTAKSDDVEGRTKIYEAMVKGTNTLEAGTPVSFDVLCNEIRGLGLNIQLEKKTVLD